MSDAVAIVSLNDLVGSDVDGVTSASSDRQYREAESIFWETASTQSFDSEDSRSAFLWRYFGYYAVRAPELFLIAVDGGKRVLGYVCAVSDTRFHRELYAIASHVPVFDDLYDAYPAHLHINLGEASRGRGLGGVLIRNLESRLRRLGVTGLHLVTSAGARNVRFYRKNGFERAVERRLPGGSDRDPPLLFLGKSL